MDILRMTQDHIHQVAQLEAECFSMPWSENAIAGELSNPLSLWLVAVEDGVVAGYIGSQTVLGEADMMNVAVSANHRRKGIGRALVNALIDRLRENNAYSLTLEVRASNDAAIRLYDSMGFEMVGRRPGYYTAPKEDALILRKEWQV